MHIIDLCVLARAARGVLLGLLEHGEVGGSTTAVLALAAVDLGYARGVLADELALGLGAVGLVALPVALGFLADSLALGLGGLAGGDAVGLLADSDALGAVNGFAGIGGALHFALGLLALNIAHSVL